MNLCPNLTVAENILIGRQPTRFGVSVDWKALNARARGYLKQLDVEIDVTRPLGSYSVAIQQMAAIARALVVSNAKVLILDEPTSSLTAHETSQLFGVMRKLKSEGIAIVFITHFLDQVYEVSDRVTVLRNGALVGTYETAPLARLELIRLMLGRSIADLDDMTAHKIESSQPYRGRAAARSRGAGSLELDRPVRPDAPRRRGRGTRGLAGFGPHRGREPALRHRQAGRGHADHGRQADQGLLAGRRRSLAAIALCPEDRKVEGIIADLTVRENIVLAMQAGLGWFRRIGTKEQYEIADKYIKLLNITTPTADQQVKNLSGGNQQKVILARWLAANPRLLILDEPTRGIDVGTKADIQKLVLSLAEEGKSCVFISSELDEVLRTSHRIVVMRDRAKVTEFSGQVDEKEIMQAIAGGAS